MEKQIGRKVDINIQLKTKTERKGKQIDTKVES